MSNEPVRTSAALATLLTAIGGLVVVFVPGLTDVQRAAITVAFAAVANVVAAVLARSQVVPLSKVRAVTETDSSTTRTEPSGGAP